MLNLGCRAYSFGVSKRKQKGILLEFQGSGQPSVLGLRCGDDECF